VYYLDGGRNEALAATATLPAAFEFYETTYGPYPFGDRVASVSVDWGAGDFGGMEHHPFWHIARGSMARPAVHHHEAAHGWFGNGVLLKCREDFVLSEGTVSYLEARAHEATGGDPTPFWFGFQARLERGIARRDFVVYPDGCNEIGSLLDIFSSLPYMKGAFFFRQVEHRVGRSALDAALSRFYRSRVGTAASMQELIDHIELATGFQLDDLETGWLKSKGIPCVLRSGDCVPQ
jgi:aminopeptidase N